MHIYTVNLNTKPEVNENLNCVRAIVDKQANVAPDTDQEMHIVYACKLDRFAWDLTAGPMSSGGKQAHCGASSCCSFARYISGFIIVQVTFRILNCWI